MRAAQVMSKREDNLLEIHGNLSGLKLLTLLQRDFPGKLTQTPLIGSNWFAYRKFSFLNNPS